MRRFSIPLALALLTVLAGVSPAGATKPSITPGEPFEALIPFPDVCPDFELEATVRGRTKTIVFVDADGNPTRSFSGGQLFVTWTRLDTMASLTLTISGPGFYDAEGIPVGGAGRWTTPLEGTGWVLANGNLTIDGFDPDGWSLIADYDGRATSICDLMA